MLEQLWNDNWEYTEETVHAGIGGSSAKNVKKITLPHDAMLEHEAKEDSKNGFSGGYRDGTVSHYRKRFFVPEDWKQKTFMLKFEGVYMNASVFVNDEFAGKCHYGYNTFYVELDQFLNYGAENEVHVVVINNGMPNSRWYSGGGIYRDVYLMMGGMIYFEQDSLQISTCEADDEYAVLNVSFTVKGRISHTKKLTAKLTFTDEKEYISAREELPFLLYEGTEKTLRASVLVKKPALWSDETPRLYQAEARIYGENEELFDTARIHFGIRTIVIDASRGLRVNGIPVKLKGACIHHDNGILGAASYEEAAYRKMKKLKEAGFNAVRVSHHPMGQAELRASDRAGMYVMDETFDMWNTAKNDFDYSLFFDEDWKYTLEMLVKKDFNHPSVVMYSLGNEIPESGSDHGIELMSKMTDFIKRRDPGRFVTQAVNGVFAAGNHMNVILQDVMDDLNAREGHEEINDFMTVMQDHLGEIMQHDIISERLNLISSGLDLVGYNYMASRYEKDKKEVPSRVIFGSETYPPAIVKEWDIVESCPNCIGEFTWAGWDYLGETGVGISEYAPAAPMSSSKYPNQLAFVGDLDITGFRRPMSYLREIVVGKQDKIYIAVQDPNHYGQEQLKNPWRLSDAMRGWDYPGCTGKPVIVEVYSAAEEVELWVNGSSCGRKPAGRENGYRVLFDTFYQPGKVEAAAYRNGREVGRDILRSAEEDLHVVIQQEENYLEGKLIFLEIMIEDAKGNVATNSCDEITIEVNGAELLGFGSADFAPAHNYNENAANLFRGRAQAILRRNGSESAFVIIRKGTEETRYDIR